MIKKALLNCAGSTTSLLRSTVNKAVYLNSHKNRKLNYELYSNRSRNTKCQTVFFSVSFETPLKLKDKSNPITGLDRP